MAVHMGAGQYHENPLWQDVYKRQVYGCPDCSGCMHKAKCLYKYDAEKDAEKNKVMKINEQWEALDVYKRQPLPSMTVIP